MVVEFIASNIHISLVGIGFMILCLEAIAPGGQFMIPGLSLTLAGLTSLLLGGIGVIPLAVLIIFYGAISFMGYSKLDIYGGSGQQQTSNASTLEGNRGHVIETVTKTSGSVKLVNGGFASTYSARSEFGDDIDEGTEIIVTDPGGGNVITVRPKESEIDDIDRELSKEKSTSKEMNVETE